MSMMRRMCSIYRLCRSCRPHPRWVTHLSLIVGMTLTGAVAASPAEIPVARYSSVQALPTSEQADPLAGVVTISFPEPVDSVGAAVVLALRTSGYRVADDAATQVVRTALFALPLPEAHRMLGPLPLRTLLKTLAGPGHRLIEDPVHRLITFEKCGESSPSRILTESAWGRSE